MSTATRQPADLRLLTEDDMFNALVERDIRVDGRVFFAITSTGIYCRPVCPARKPLRKNVRFYLTPAAAERAGFRACKRCHPKEAVQNPAMALVERACADIDANACGDLSLAAIAIRIGSSPHHLQRTFKAMLGVSPKAYIAARRIDRFKSSVRNGSDVTSALYDAGYGSSSRLYERANAELGMTPGSYRDGGRDVQIQYTVAQTELGPLLVAGTPNGLCAIRIGQSSEALTQGLQAEFPAAELAEGSADLAAAVERIVAHIDGKSARIDLPLDVRATAFQRRVWEALQAIPSGETRTYGEIAHEIGQPAAFRAVAQACANNPVAIVVPCHRVVRTDGGLGGYRWGIDRKSELLRREREAAAMTTLKSPASAPTKP